MTKGMKAVGVYVQAFNDLTGQSIPCGIIYQSNGLRTHVERRHPQSIGLMNHIETVIKAPDYVGAHPQEENSVELVKRIDENIMVCIKLDNREGYLYVASVFLISESKFNNRLTSGRLRKY